MLNHFFTTTLQAGRRVAINVRPHLQAVTTGTDTHMYFAISAMRLHASGPEKLCGHLAVGSLDEAEAPNVQPTWHDSGCCVSDVLAGRADWASAEVDEFRLLVTRDENFNAWLRSAYEELNDAIKESPLWGMDLMVIGEEIDTSAMMRAIIMKAAMKADAMASLRAKRA